MIELGSVYPAAMNVYDDNGDLANATGVSLQITLPDLTVVTPAIQNPPVVTGQYVYPYTTTQPGRHIVKWTTSNPVTTWRDVFDVSEDLIPSILSLADAKRQVGIDPADTANDDEIRQKLLGLTRAMELSKHEVIVQRSVTEVFSWPLYGWSWQQPTMRLTYVPVISLTSVASTDQVGVTYDVNNNLYLDKDSGLVTVINGPPLAGRITATYVAGYQIIPYNYLEAALIVFQHNWESRRGPGGVGGVTGPEELSDYRHFTSMPRKAMELLGPPRPVVF